MKKWVDFFKEYRVIEVKNDDDLLYQVGTTVGGDPISKNQFNNLILDIKNKLDLNNRDHLLDLCCGNGILTFELAKVVMSVLGIDSSETYISNANRFKIRSNIKYLVGDVLDLSTILENMVSYKFTKVLLYASLAYFNITEFNSILNSLRKYTTDNAIILVGSVLDKEKKFKYFNTLKRKIHYFIKYVLLRRDYGLGKWWDKREIQSICEKNGYTATFFPQDESLHTAHYRYDVVIIKNKNSN